MGRVRNKITQRGDNGVSRIPITPEILNSNE